MLALASVTENHRPSDENPAGVIVEINFFEYDTPIPLPPNAAREIPDNVVSVDDVEEEAPSGFERAADGRGHAEVGFLIEVAK